MVNWRAASFTNSLAAGLLGCFPPCKSSKHRANRQSKTSEVAFVENVASHDFAGRIEVRERTPPAVQNPCGAVHRDSQVCESDAWPQREWIKRWLVDRQSPISFGRQNALRSQAIFV